MLEVHELSPAQLNEYAAIPISFRVASVFDVGHRDGGGFVLTERPLAEPYTKDYDALPGNKPTDWPARFDLAQWGLFVVPLAGELAGGAAVAPASSALEDDAGPETAVLFDLRVREAARRRGIATALFAASLSWARDRGHRRLSIETQSTNAAGCRFYSSLGCVLAAADPHAYPELPDETRLLWHYDLSGADD